MIVKILVKPNLFKEEAANNDDGAIAFGLKRKQKIQRFPLIRLPLIKESPSIHSRADATQSTGMSITRRIKE